MEPTQPCEVARCFDACAAALVLFARSYVGQAEAEDLVQDAFLKAMGQNGQVRDLKAWLFQTVRNAADNAGWILESCFGAIPKRSHLCGVIPARHGESCAVEAAGLAAKPQAALAAKPQLREPEMSVATSTPFRSESP